jgi:hypothetical protein
MIQALLLGFLLMGLSIHAVNAVKLALIEKLHWLQSENIEFVSNKKKIKRLFERIRYDLYSVN